MARKLPQLQRVLDAPALASVAYGEIASSLYFALGIIALHALGFTPLVLGIVGLLFLIVALSYAEGTASIRETGGAAPFVRVAINDFAGVRLFRRTQMYTFGIGISILDLLTQLLLVGGGMVLLFSPSALTRGLSLGTHPSWHDIAFAI